MKRAFLFLQNSSDLVSTLFSARESATTAAQNARRISGFADLDGIEFLGKVDWEKDQNGQDKCVIKSAVTPDHKDYAALMGGASQPAPAASAPNSYAQATGRSPVPGRPSWAQ